MRSSVAAKLFVAVFAPSMLVAVAMGVAARISFTQGFLGYLNEQGRERMESVIPDLVDAYRENGSWAFLRHNQRAWFRLIRPQLQDSGGDGAQGDMPLPPDVEMTGINLRVAVLDASRHLVIGYPAIGPTAVLKPIVVDGAMVGWLAMVPFEEATVAADVRFQQRQLRATWIIGGMAGLVAAVVAWGLAQLFLAPVRRVATATRLLAAGHHGIRVRSGSKDEVGRLADDFNQLAQTLEKNEQMRRAFIADISHELRTPLSVLLGELEALEDGVRPLTADSVRSLQSEARHLNKLVSDLYDLSLSDEGALAYRKVELDACEILQASLDAMRERLAARSLKLTLSPAPEQASVVLGDEARLRQLFDNLLENSWRYTDPGGELRVSLGHQAGRLQIEFADSAPGVADELLPRLFERFFRVEASRNRASGGAGLGLAICRNIALAHGAELRASASELGGLSICLLLPLLAPLEPAA